VLIDGKKIVERGNFKYLALFVFDATMSCGCNKFRTTISLKESKSQSNRVNVKAKKQFPPVFPY